MGTVHLSPGRVEPLAAGHPWVLAQDVERVQGAPGAGDVVTVVDPRGRLLGKGYYSPRSAVPVRLLSRDEGARLDDAWLGRRIDEAAAWRRELLALPDPSTDGYRLVHGEGDGLAGLVVDVLGDVAAVRLHTPGMKQREEAIFGHVARVTRAQTIIELASPRRQRAEGFEAQGRVVRGPDVEALRFRERGLEYEIPLDVVHELRFDLAQRENRGRVEALAEGERVLDAFSYVGPFSLAAARGGAEAVLAIDSAAPVVATAARLARRNGYEDVVEVMRADLERALGDLAAEHRRFGLVVADPPKLVPTTRHLESGTKAYRRLNTMLLRLVGPGGLLVTSSSSAALTEERFLRTLGLAARDADRETKLLWLGRQAPDHPVPPAFPEGRFLDCAVLRVS